MEKVPTFDDATMRKITSIKQAIEIFTRLRIPRRRIIAVYQKAYTVAVGSVSINVLAFDNTETLFEYLKKKGSSESNIKAWEVNLKKWEGKYEPIKDSVTKRRRTTTVEATS